MERKWRWGVAAPIIAACAVLADCNGSATNTPGPTTAYAVLRLKSTDGSSDGGFAGGSGIAITDVDPALFDFALAVVLQPVDANPLNDKIVVGGSSGLAGQGVIALVRYNPDGSLDPGFGISGIVKTPAPSGWTSASASAIAVQPVDNKIVVAALTFNAATGKTGIELLRYTTTGALDAGFGTNGVVNPVATIGSGQAGDACALVLQGANIIVAGASSDGNVVLYRYDSNGVLDATFGAGGVTTTSIGTTARSPAIALQSDNSIVLASGTDVDQVLVHYSSNGVLDTGFGGAPGGIVSTDVGGGVNYANAVAVQSNDKIVVAGHANLNFSTDASDISLVRYTATGTLDTAFNPAGTRPGTLITDLAGKFDNALSLALQDQSPAEPKIVISGNTGTAGFSQMAVLRYNPDASLDTTFGPGSGGVVLVNIAGPSNVASGNAVVLQPVSTGVAILVAGYD